MRSRHGVLQGHVLGPIKRQLLGAIVVNNLRNAGKHAAALVQRVAVLFGLSHDDVHTTLAGLESNRILASA